MHTAEFPHAETSVLVGLRARAIAFVIVVVIGALALSTVSSIVNTNALLSAEQERNAHNKARNLAIACESALASGDHDELARLSREQLNDLDTEFNAIYDAGNELLASSVRDDEMWARYRSRRRTNPSAGREFLATAPVLQLRDLGQVPFEPGREKLLGYVVVALSGEPLVEARASNVTASLMVMLFAALTIVPLVLWIVGAWTRRLGAVVVATEKISLGDLTPSPNDDSSDEIGRLWRAHERMRRALETREREMRTFNERLQAEVEERTRALVVEKDRAESANRAKSEFLANMSHELRTPMHGILSFASFGIDAEQAPRDKIREYFQRIRQCGNRLLVMLNDLLDLAKLEAGRVELSKSRANLGALTSAIVEEFDSLLRERRQTIEFDARDIVVVIDQHKIMQVVRNLIGNAIKFSPEGGTIEIDVRIADNQVEFSVSDRGIGIPADELELVFEKFIQSSQTKTGAGGTGLGLSICRQIVQMHGGTIRAVRREGGGTRFEFRLPYDREAASRPASGRFVAVEA